MTVRENNMKRIEGMNKYFWLLLPDRPLISLYALAGQLQDKLYNWIEVVDDKKTAAVDALYYELHESEDV